jgi:hypothetical protein
MAIETRSAFIYGHTINDDNSYLNFTENGIDELTAIIEVGSYTLDQFKDAVAVALNDIGDNEYIVSVDRDTRKITISANANFDLLVTTGTNVSISAFPLIGFSSNKSLSSSYEADNQTGFEFRPQTPLGKYNSFEHNTSSVQSKVNESSAGDIEVVSYGTRNFMDFNIKYATNITGQLYIEDNLTGVEDLDAFMQYITQKRPIEFLPDRDNKNLFIPTLLESTSTSKDGTGYTLRELYAKKMANYFETGKLVFRKL